MASLRARLIATLLALTTIGMLLLGGITYVEQRSFQYERVDQQVKQAEPLVERAVYGDDGGDGDRGPGPGPGGGRDFGPPSGTYLGIVTRSGKVVAGKVIRLETTGTAERPKLPRTFRDGEIVTVSGTGGTSYRLLAQYDPYLGAVKVVAVPLREATATLHRLLLVEGLVIAAVLAALAAVAWVVVRIGLLPLDRMGHTAGRIAGGDLSYRVQDTDPRTEVGRLGASLNAMLDRLEGAFAERQASEDKLRQFLADASHELRTPLASIRGYAELFRMGALPDDAERAKALRRIEDEAARMGVLVEDLLTLARLDEVADAPHEPIDVSTLVRDAVSDARATAPAREIAGARGRAARRLRRRPPAAPGAREPHAQRADAHAGRHAGRGLGRTARTATSGWRSATTGRACRRRRTRARSSGASGAPRPAAPAARAAPAWAWPSWRRSWTPTAAACGRPTPTAAVRASWSSCPPRAEPPPRRAHRRSPAVGAPARPWVSEPEWTPKSPCTSTARRTASRWTRAPRCWTRCASTSGSPAPRRAATTASAAPAPCCSTGAGRTPASRSPSPTTAAQVTTVEGLGGADGALHPLQEAFIAHDAFQCGYCTPGQLCSAAGMIEEARGEGAALDDDYVRDRMSGNLCRCGAYRNIVPAIQEAGSAGGAGRGGERSVTL